MFCFILCGCWLILLSFLSPFQASLLAFSQHRLCFCFSAFAEIMLIFVGENAVHWAISVHQLAGSRLHRQCSRAWRVTNLSGAATTRRGPLRNVPHKPVEKRLPREKNPVAAGCPDEAQSAGRCSSSQDGAGWASRAWMGSESDTGFQL